MIRSLFAELRRRHVFKVAALYAAVAWALIEGANTILPRLNLPDWSVTFLIIVTIFGFPLALVLAWAYDLTSDGVRRTDPPAGIATVQPAPTRAQPGQVAVLLLGIGAALALSLLIRSGGNAPVAGDLVHRDIRSVAVLPFRSAGSGTADEYLSEGIAEELLHRLARVPELRVAARTSSFAFRQEQADVREIGARLNVDVVLEVSVRSVGDRLRISARLVSTRDGFQLWSESYERETTDVFRMQDEIASAIVERLRPRGAATGDVATGPAEPAHVTIPAVAEPASYEAFQLYMRGRYEWSRRTQHGLQSAVRYFEQAIARSPDYARAHLGLADASAVLGFYDHVPPMQAFPDARRAASRALELDAALTEAHATLAYVALYFDHDFVAAEDGFRRAIRLNPDYAVAHQWYGNLLTAMGRFTEARREVTVAQQLDPLALIGSTAEGWVSIYARDYDRAIRQFDDVLQRDSTYFLSLVWKGMALELAGRPAEAVTQLRRALELSPHSVLAESALARALAAGGEEMEARHILNALEARSAREYIASYDIALIHVALGNSEAALARLEQAADERAHALAFLKVDPRLDRLRTDPRFERLGLRIGGG